MFKKIRNAKAARLINALNAFNEEIYLEKIGAETLSENALVHFIKHGNEYGISPNSNFDMMHYLSTYPDVKNNGINGLYHYISRGFYEDRRPMENTNFFFWWSKLSPGKRGLLKNLRILLDCFIIFKSKTFDSIYYCDMYPDVAHKVQSRFMWKFRDSAFAPLRFLSKALTSPISHYVKCGAYEGRQPSRTFDTRYYINRYSDVRLSKMNPYAHFVKFGQKEGRACLDCDNPLGGKNPDCSFADQFINQKSIDVSTTKTTVVVAIDENMPLGDNRLNSILNQKNAEFEVFLAVKNPLSKKDCSYLAKLKDENPVIRNIFAEDNLNIALEKISCEMTGNFFIINCSETVYSEDFIFQSVSAFKDDSIMAIKATDASCDKMTYSNKLIADGISFVENDKAISSYTFRNLRKTSFFQNDISTSFGRLTFILENALGGAYGEVSAENTLISSIADITAQEKELDIKKHFHLLSLMHNIYHISGADLRILYENFRTKYLAETSCSICEFKELYNITDIFEKGQIPTVMISILAFTHGGGEIMPIRIANYLKKIGVNVIVHNYGYDEDEPKVRDMLDSSITVITTKQADELAAYLRLLNIDVVNSHHVNNQMLLGEIYHSNPYIKSRVSHVATQHGMFEAFDKKTFEYIAQFLDTNVNRWTYVADKNLVPFKKLDNFDQNMFVKTSNGVESSIDESINRKSIGLSEKSFVLCLASRAIEEKGWKEAINAVSLARKSTGKDIVLILVGAGPIYDELKDNVPDYIKLIGFSNKVQSYYALSDMTILPSFYKSESAPLTIIESLVAGTPVIASDIGEIRSMIEHKGTFAGECFTLENWKVNVNKLAGIIASFAQSKEKYDSAKKAAEQHGNRFHMKNVAKEYMDVYESCLKYDRVSIREAEKTKKSISLLESSHNPWESTLVSIIVPCYNHDKYLKERLDSIYNQTYKNYEVILMDDCSKDNSRKILSEYAQRYKDKTTLLFNEENSGGVFKQWSKGIRAAKGRICWIAESDDYCDWDFIEKLLPSFDDGKVKLAYSKYVFVDENGEPLKNFTFDNYTSHVGNQKWHLPYCNDAETEVNQNLGIINSIPNVSAVLFVNPNANPILDDTEWLSMRLCGDWMFYLNIIRGGKVCYTPETNNYYRIHSSSTSKAVQSTENYYKERAKIVKIAAGLYNLEDRIIQKHGKILKAEYDYMSVKPDKSFEDLFNVEELIDFNNAQKELRKATSFDEATDNTDCTKPVLLATAIKLEATADTFEIKMRDVGENTGNMMFVNALKNQLDVKKCDFYHHTLFQDKTDVSCVIPSANFIICGDAIEDDGIKFLENTEFPITLAGLGAQASARYNTPKTLVNALNPEKIKFFKMAAERAVTLGIRGEFTAECLEIMGIKNYRIIGCPSFYSHMDGVLPEIKNPTAEKTIVSVTSGSSFETELAKFGYANNSDWVIQMTTELPFMETGEIKYSQQNITSSFPGLNFDESMLAYMKEHRKIFFDINEWNSYLENGGFTFAYGSRFHGNMNAFNHGIPTLWIVHDNRTKELTETLHLPHITFHEFISINSMEQLMERCNYEDTIKNYPKLLDNYKQFLKENGLKLKK